MNYVYKISAIVIQIIASLPATHVRTSKTSDFHFDDMLQLSCCDLQYLTAIAKYKK